MEFIYQGERMQFKKIEEKQYMDYKVEHGISMDNLVNTDYFNQLKKDTKKLDSLFEHIKGAIEQHRIEDFSDSLIKSIKTAEELVHKLKALPINFGIDSTIIRNVTHLCNTDLLHIEKTEEDTYRIVFKDLLPRRMKNGNMTENMDYLRNHYFTAFENFFGSRYDFRKYTERVVIIYKNYFSEVNGIMDDDNFDIKIITDFIAQYMLIDDNPVRCMKVFDYGMDKNKHSEITVMPEKRYFEKMIEQRIP